MKQVENRQNTLMKKVWQSWRRFWEEEDGMGTVEVILIIVVLVGLVMIFKEEITDIVDSLFSKITSQTNRL